MSKAFLIIIANHQTRPIFKKCLCHNSLVPDYFEVKVGSILMTMVIKCKNYLINKGNKSLKDIILTTTTSKMSRRSGTNELEVQFVRIFICQSKNIAI